jgi:hypothetical protein
MQPAGMVQTPGGSPLALAPLRHSRLKGGEARRGSTQFLLVPITADHLTG